MPTWHDMRVKSSGTFNRAYRDETSGRWRDDVGVWWYEDQLGDAGLSPKEPTYDALATENASLREQLAAVTAERDEARAGYAALDSNWATLHEMMGSSIREALGMPNASVPEMVQRIGELITAERLAREIKQGE
jgi:hypothetical protein